MKILVCHNRYRLRGGEDSVVENESELLSRHGHQVELFHDDSRKIHSIKDKFNVAIHLPYSEKSKQSLKKTLAQFEPDIVHIHNFFPLLTPSLYDACIEARKPVVQTFHNFRIMCANALLLRDGKPCELCIEGSSLFSLKYKCYRDSRIATLPLTRMISHHRREKTWNRKTDVIIALSLFAKSRFEEFGIDPGRIVVKPNFVCDPLADKTDIFNAGTRDKPRALYVGRLSEEKGIQTLLDAWKNVPFPLTIIGEGPLKNLVATQKNPQITYVGPKDKKEVLAEMSAASALVIPSVCYENCPMVIPEAYSVGLPIIASRTGSLPEFIPENQTGFLFEPGSSDDLARVASRFLSNRQNLGQLSKNCRESFEKLFSARVHLSKLEEIYSSAIQLKNSNSRES